MHKNTAAIVSLHKKKKIY